MWNLCRIWVVSKLMHVTFEYWLIRLNKSVRIGHWWELNLFKKQNSSSLKKMSRHFMQCFPFTEVLRCWLKMLWLLGYTSTVIPRAARESERDKRINILTDKAQSLGLSLLRDLFSRQQQEKLCNNLNDRGWTTDVLKWPHASFQGTGNIWFRAVLGCFKHPKVAIQGVSAVFSQWFLQCPTALLVGSALGPGRKPHRERPMERLQLSFIFWY